MWETDKWNELAEKAGLAGTSSAERQRSQMTEMASQQLRFEAMQNAQMQSAQQYQAPQYIIVPQPTYSAVERERIKALFMKQEEALRDARTSWTSKRTMFTCQLCEKESIDGSDAAKICERAFTETPKYPVGTEVALWTTLESIGIGTIKHYRYELVDEKDQPIRHCITGVEVAFYDPDVPGGENSVGLNVLQVEGSVRLAQQFRFLGVEHLP